MIIYWTKYNKNELEAIKQISERNKKIQFKNMVIDVRHYAPVLIIMKYIYYSMLSLNSANTPPKLPWQINKII